MATYNAELRWVEAGLDGKQTPKYKTIYGIHANDSETAKKMALTKVDASLAAKVLAVWSEPDEE